MKPASSRAILAAASACKTCPAARHAMGCLRSPHLANKAAERAFLERVPLPDEVREELWLDEPAEWIRLADAADAWGLRWSRTQGRPPDRSELAGLWWTEEVVPMLDRLRGAGVGLDLRDVQLYMTALAAASAMTTGVPTSSTICERRLRSIAGAAPRAFRGRFGVVVERGSSRL